ncbi:hypothetical protein M747DRAFT_339989 [Aspergillus niger ATCC 13496]|uniref:HIG1 domain-containing protein n=1 Tax=Aspergillus niger ATCC 13496 TaxID=1353008 RepID=A0A370C792_ASPNG|nr:hypothetical protein CBS115988_10510 [Aspergillus niger]RDH21763.1 hypothetical protein M747DRAFT_339989 [Aspergillus niger ATCC 13496]
MHFNYFFVAMLFAGSTLALRGLYSGTSRALLWHRRKATMTLSTATGWGLTLCVLQKSVGSRIVPAPIK